MVTQNGWRQSSQSIKGAQFMSKWVGQAPVLGAPARGSWEMIYRDSEALALKEPGRRQTRDPRSAGSLISAERNAWREG